LREIVFEVLRQCRRFPSFHVEKQPRALGVSALVNKSAQSELVKMIDQLLKPQTGRHGDEFDSMT